jgi:hypothetical protein
VRENSSSTPQHTCISFVVMVGDSNPRKGLDDRWEPDGSGNEIEPDGSGNALSGEGGPWMRQVCRMECACVEPSTVARDGLGLRGREWPDVDVPPACFLLCRLPFDREAIA